ncbi:MAG: cytosine permease, partial [Clostridiaceae bacterium]|nr:cytosine permease [Clostridiaceae bacterium]
MAKNQEVQTDAVVDVDFSFVRVPKKARTRGFWSMFVIMLGFTFFSASMSVGARMANGLDFTGFLLAVILGGAILAVYTGALGYIGSNTGMSLDLLCQRSFGTKGSYLPSALISFTQIGWFGVGAAMFSIPVSEMLGINPW